MMPSPPTPLPTLGEGRGIYKKYSTPKFGRGEKNI
jgi:hypothetical protein